MCVPPTGCHAFGGGEGSLRTLFSTTFKCSVSQNYPRVREVRTKPPMIGGEQQIKEIIEGGSGGELVSSAKSS